MSMKERMLAGELYRADDPELVAEAVRAALLMERFNATSVADFDQRGQILEELLGSVGEGVRIRPPFYCDYGHHIRIGAGSFVNYGAVMLDVAPITVGADVQIGPLVQLLTPTHPIEPRTRQAGWESGHPITIADNVWLGGGAIVLPGVTIGENTVVGAASVVTHDLPPNVVAVGNPARVVRVISPESP